MKPAGTDLADRLLERIERICREHRLLPRNTTWVVAVSGGVDSVVLSHLLHRLAPAWSSRLILAHLNHNLRGASSRADQRFVQKLAHQLHCGFVSESAAVRRVAQQQGVSLEMAAREVRHDFLARTAIAAGSRRVVLAHHADDQLETFLLRCLRGAGGEGLAGMRWSGPSPADRRVRLVRPLLEIPKSDLIAYARQCGLGHREDATNAEPSTPRNWIRLRMIPELRRQFGEHVTFSLLRTMALVGAEADCVGRLAAHWLAGRASAEEFEQLHPAVQRRAVRDQLIRVGLEPGFQLVEALRLNPGRVQIAGPRRGVWRDATGRIHRAEPASEGFDPRRCVVPLSGRAGRTAFGGGTLDWRVRRRAGDRGWREVARNRGGECYDADRVGRRIELRFWGRGDRFQPIGMPGPVKLQDLFVNLKVPVVERRRRLVAVDESGAIFWVEGLRMSERHKLTKTTCRWLIWRWRRPGPSAGRARLSQPAERQDGKVAGWQAGC